MLLIFSKIATHAGWFEFPSSQKLGFQSKNLPPNCPRNAFPFCCLKQCQDYPFLLHVRSDSEHTSSHKWWQLPLKTVINPHTYVWLQYWTTLPFGHPRTMIMMPSVHHGSISCKGESFCRNSLASKPPLLVLVYDTFFQIHLGATYSGKSLLICSITSCRLFGVTDDIAHDAMTVTLRADVSGCRPVLRGQFCAWETEMPRGNKLFRANAKPDPAFAKHDEFALGSTRHVPIEMATSKKAQDPTPASKFRQKSHQQHVAFSSASFHSPPHSATKEIILMRRAQIWEPRTLAMQCTEENLQDLLKVLFALNENALAEQKGGTTRAQIRQQDVRGIFCELHGDEAWCCHENCWCFIPCQNEQFPGTQYWLISWTGFSDC